MFCNQCGAKVQIESKFCNHCGTAVAIPLMEDREEAAGLETGWEAPEASVDPAAQTRAPAVKSKIQPLHWILPLVSLLIAGSVAGAAFLYQKSVNRDVERLLHEGEKLALDGNFSGGIARIETALRKRPDHRVLLADQAILKEAATLQSRMSDTSKQVKDKKFDDALKGIDLLQVDLKKRSGPVFQRLLKEAGKQKELIVVSQVESDFPDKKTVADLTPLWMTIKEYESAEAKKASGEIIRKIVDIAYDKASGQVKDKKFSEALLTLDEALKLDEANAKLTALKSTVEEQKKAFEEAENKRIQQAREAATREDLKNRTEAVELVSVNAYTDSNGNFVVEGSVKNKATRPLSFVVVYFDIYDGDGNFVSHGSVYVSPNYLDVGDTGAFYNNYYNDGSLSSVNVTSFEWQIN